MSILTYSRNVFLPVTDLCRNRCGYCSFRREPEKARIISRKEARVLLEQGARSGCTEALFSLGESPQSEESYGRLAAAAGISDLAEYLAELCEMALDAGLLPHTNAGLISRRDLRTLSPLNASMGLMLETTAHVKAHEKSPGKEPDLRIKHIAEAGRLKIPFTTGILMGIGESWMDRENSLRKIAELHRKFGHIQEVIIQPLDPKPGTALENWAKPSVSDVADVIKLARCILPPEVAVQVPPNLIDPLPPVKAGAHDLGGLSTITPDWINPDRPWPALKELASRLKGYALKERLPVHPHFVLKRWYGQKTGELIESLADDAGLRRKDYL